VEPIDFLDRARLRHPKRPQPNDSNAVGRELSGQTRVSDSTALIAGPTPPIKGMPVLAGVEVTVMITPDRFRTIRRAARRAVTKYDLV